MLKLYSRNAVVPPKLNNLMSLKANEKSISKSLKVLFTLMIILFSFDFGFIKFKSSKGAIFLVRCFCVLKTLITSIAFTFFVTITLEDFNHMYYLCVCTFEHGAVVFVLIFRRNITFFKFYYELLIIDEKLGIKVSGKLEFLATTLITCSFIHKLVGYFLYCNGLEYKEYCSPLMYIDVITNLMAISNDVFLIIYLIIYYFLYYRLKVFTDVIFNGCYDIVICQCLYKKIADLTDRLTAFNNLYAVFLFLNTTVMMTTTFRPLLLTDLRDMSLNFAAGLSVLVIFVTLFSPAFAAGLLSSQVDQLRVKLQNRLLQEKDQKQVMEIEKFVRYIEVRPLRVTIWKIIPLDWQLPVITVNLMVTYLIVVLQFSHRY